MKYSMADHGPLGMSTCDHSVVSVMCHVPDEERNQAHTGKRSELSGKVAPRGRPCIFIGYVHTTTKAWKVIDLHSFRVGIYRDVVFDEDSFPRLPAEPISFSKVFEHAKPPLTLSKPFPASTSDTRAYAHQVQTSSPVAVYERPQTTFSSSRSLSKSRPPKDPSGTSGTFGNIPHHLLDRNKRWKSALLVCTVASAANRAYSGKHLSWATPEINWTLIANNRSNRRALRYDENGDPLNLTTAKIKDWDQWSKSILAEWAAHKRNETFQVVMRVDLPPDASIISSKWVFKRKILGDGSRRFKARLVIRGFLQQEGIDYETTYAPTASMTTLRLLLALAAYFNWSLWNINFVTAFLNGYVDEEIYMEYPEGLEELVDDLPPRSEAVLKLIKALYGLKQSPRIWWNVINDFLLSLGFHCCADSDVNLYTLTKDGLFIAVLLFVDDMLFVGDMSLIQEVVQALKEEFELRDLGEPDLFLGIQLRQQKEGLFIHQERYTRKILDRFHMSSAKPVNTPLPPKTVLNSETDDRLLLDSAKATHYRAIVGALMYLVVCTRPDLAFALSRLSKFSAKPAKKHLHAAEHTLRYLRGTQKHGILYRRATSNLASGSYPLLGYSDSAFADDPDNRRSTSAFLFVLNGSAIHWKSKQQSLVSRSTHDAEYIGLANASYEITWLRRMVSSLLQNVESATEPTELRADNQSAITTAHAPPDSTSSPRTKHIDIRFHIIREAINRGDIKLTYIRTESMLADALTKSLPAPAHSKHMKDFGMMNGEDL